MHKDEDSARGEIAHLNGKGIPSFSLSFSFSLFLRSCFCDDLSYLTSRDLCLVAVAKLPKLLPSAFHD